MEPEAAWSVITDSVKTPWSSKHISVFQKLIRRRFRKKGYGSFRVPEYEEIIGKSKKYTLLYAKCVVMGKLPEHMHRRMLAWGIAHPDDEDVKFYFEVCEGKASYTRPPWWPS